MGKVYSVTSFEDESLGKANLDLNLIYKTAMRSRID